MNTTTNQSLFDVVESLDNTARVAALRGITHSSMAKCIGAIRQHIRNEARNVRNAEDPQIDLDQRNEHDENHRVGSTTDDIRGGFNFNEPTDAADEAKNYMGFSSKVPPLKQASLFHAVYDWAAIELDTLSDSKWDKPLTVEEMVDFMATKVPTLEPALVQALADAARTDVKNIERMHELQAQRELEQLLEAKPEILLTFKGFGNNGYEKSIVDLPKVAQHQLGVKVVESLNKARDQVFSRVMRTRRIADLGSVPLIEDAAKQVKEWVTLFEEQHKDELNEAIEAGRSIRTLDDIEEP